MGKVQTLGWRLALRPSGRLEWVRAADGLRRPTKRLRDLRSAFEHDLGTGLLALAHDEWPPEAPPELGWLRMLTQDVLSAICTLPSECDDPALVEAAVPSAEQLADRARDVPPFPGFERAAEAIGGWADAIAQTLGAEVCLRGQLQHALEQHAPDWHPHDRIWLHLAENTAEPDRPFAFLATFTPPEGGRQLPLSEALKTYRDDREALEALLAPLARAADRSPWFAELVETKEIFHPLALDAAEAHQFLEAAEGLRGTGVRVRFPRKWRGRSRNRPGVGIRIGEHGESIDLTALLSFDVGLTLPDGTSLSTEETASLLEGVPRLVFLRGEWMEVDPSALRATLEAWQNRESPTVAEGLRLLAELEGSRGHWTRVEAGAFLERALAPLRAPGGLEPSPALKATLRPYQKQGLAWLSTVCALELGGCLADDMGLGKTIQVIALLLHLKDRGMQGPAVIVAPTSLLSNWLSELARFAPELRVFVAHRSHTDKKRLAEGLARPEEQDVLLTSYGTLHTLELRDRVHPLVVIDEAQAIKNPGSRQAKAVRALKASARIALTGTPIENRISDLWALFAFLDPGLLGSPPEFSKLLKRLQPPEGPGYGALRRLVGPYMLRRTKTDRSIIDDLPDKTEVDVWCASSKAQAALYERSVKELAQQLRQKSGVERRGLVLAFLTRFKQICNHPSQWLETDEWAASESGKAQELLRIAEVVHESQEKMLVFTQYRSLTGPLHDWLAGVFGEPGLVLHGGTPARKRGELVERFQDPDGPRFFVLSLKAGGTGLNLTAARHVVHFDRWWNPAVEAQATDRAYRIGQHANVLVHRFVCRGTLEERIAEMLESKRALADALLEADGSEALTELSDEALLDVVRLDRSRALELSR